MLENGCLNCWVVAWLVGWLVGCLNGCLTGWLVGFFVERDLFFGWVLKVKT